MMAPRGLLLLSLVGAVVLANGLELREPTETAGPSSASRRLLTCGHHLKKPHCCKVWDWGYCKCKEYKHDYYYHDGKCVYKYDYDCPHCCEDCNYEWKRCNRYKYGWGYDKGRCYYKYGDDDDHHDDDDDDGHNYKCPDCCEECDYHGKYCKKYRQGYYYEHGRCQKKAGPKVVRHRPPSYGGSPTATASADAKCYGRGCNTKTHTSTSSSSYGSSSTSYSHSGK